jgi:hypothetical protein
MNQYRIMHLFLWNNSLLTVSPCGSANRKSHDIHAAAGWTYLIVTYSFLRPLSDAVEEELPRPASRARIAACARSATCNLLKILDT